MQIEIPDDATARLKALAVAAGFGENVQQYVLHRSLEPQLAEVSQQDEKAGVMLPRDTWKAEFDALVGGFPKRDTHLDDSRESIYRGRGE